jgi:metallophosphoesterase superfamily enzyme
VTVVFFAGRKPTFTLVYQSILPCVRFDTRRALFLEATRTLVVADLHWGYAESHRTTGNLFPTWGDDTLEATLRDLTVDYAPAEVVWLGDSLHTTRAAPQARARAESFVTRSIIPIHVIAGNHDAGWPVARPDPLIRDRFVLHHGDRPLPPDSPDLQTLASRIEIIGHHHPAYTYRDGAGTRLKLPALVQSPGCLVLPAFSPWAAGTAWNNRLAPGETLWATSPRRLIPVRL